MFQIGPYRLDLINDGLFEDDADTFVDMERFQWRAIPKVDGGKRIRVAFNSLLVRGNDLTVVVDPGVGDKPLTDLIGAYRVEWPRRFLKTLTELGVSRESVDAVILTHLHWDHAGGATTLDKSGRVVPTFPAARYFVQRKELDAALAATEWGDDAYNANDFKPLLDCGCLTLLDGDSEVLTGISVRWTGGHCPGHQVVFIEGDGQRAIYLSDLVPTSAQLPLHSVLSYDQDRNELLAAKAAILEEAASREDLLLFVHAPLVRAARAKHDADGSLRFDPVTV